MDYNETVKKLKFEILSNMQNLLVFLTTNSLEKGNFISTIKIQKKLNHIFLKNNENYRNGELYK